MAEIDKLIEKMAERNVKRSVLISDQPMRLITDEKEIAGPAIPSARLYNIVREVVPSNLRLKLAENGKFQFSHQTLYGVFDVDVTRNNGTLQVSVAAAKSKDGTASGMGAASELPDELKGFNWGAFFLTIIWCIVHRHWLGLLYLFIGVVSAPLTLIVGAVIAICVIGSEANKIAWQNRQWSSIEEFKDTQRKWAYVGGGVFALQCVYLIWWVQNSTATY